MMMNMIEDILNISMTRSEKAVLFITTHGTVKLNKTRDLPFTKAPIKIKKLDSVKLGICNFYQPGTPKIIENIIKKSIEKDPEDLTLFIKKEFLNFENKKNMVKTRNGLYFSLIMKDWGNKNDPNHDPDILEFAKYFNNRYRIQEYDKDSIIVNKTYTVYKSESGLHNLENRIILYLNGVSYDILTTWKVKGIISNPASSAKLRTSQQISITLEEILKIIACRFKLNELIIADLSCSVFTDNHGSQIDFNRYERYLSRKTM